MARTYVAATELASDEDDPEQLQVAVSQPTEVGLIHRNTLHNLYNLYNLVPVRNSCSYDKTGFKTYLESLVVLERQPRGNVKASLPRIINYDHSLGPLSYKSCHFACLDPSKRMTKTVNEYYFL